MISAILDAGSAAPADGTTVCLASGAPINHTLQELLDAGIIRGDVWAALGDSIRRQFEETFHDGDLLPGLVEAGLLTPYQASCIGSGRAGSLRLGNYRIIDEIGAGGMGVVFRGEHQYLHRAVAIKVLRSASDGGDVLLQRFFVEMQALARIRHPNVVLALDAGTVGDANGQEPRRHYLVMEHVQGQNLEQMAANQPLGVQQACELIYQITLALEETHKLNLVHRDIKPSNILVTPRGVAKLLDFGLALHFGQRRLTMPGALLGTLGYMAPEQISDATQVDIRADIFGLGATLCFCLLGGCPFPSHGSITQQAAARLLQQPINLRERRPDIPPELETVIHRMMGHHPADRYPTPQSLLRALLPFVNKPASGGFGNLLDASPASPLAPTGLPSRRGEAARNVQANAGRILVVDDDAAVRQVCTAYFKRESFQVTEAANGAVALNLLAEQAFDLVLLDIDMPGMTGTETLRRIRRDFKTGSLKVAMMSGGVSPDEMSAMLALGADDYLSKPLSRGELVGRVRAALAYKAIQDRSEQLGQQLMEVNSDLENVLASRSSDLAAIRTGLLFGIAKIVESRTQKPTGHMARMPQYVKALALAARSVPHLAGTLSDAYVNMLERCAALHDIGNVAMPDHILCRDNELEVEDRIVMQAHTTIGAETLEGVAKRDRGATVFWQMVIDITRHHHERFDGSGYPDGLAGRDIPLAARLVALADTYDRLRTGCELGTALSQGAAVEVIVHGSPGRFDPHLAGVFSEIADRLDEVFRACPDRELEPLNCFIARQAARF